MSNIDMILLFIFQLLKLPNYLQKYIFVNEFNAYSFIEFMIHHTTFLNK